MGLPDSSSCIDVSVVIVSWNVCQLLADCIRSIDRCRGSLVVEIIVVDNNSSDGSAAMVHRDFPAVQLVENAGNVGFARANNQGFAHARGRYIFILNPDTLLLDHSLVRIVEFMDRSPNVGMTGPRLCFPHGEVQPPCARKYPSLLHFLGHDVLNLDPVPWIGRRVRGLVHPYSYDKTQEVEALSGAAMLVRREALDEVGGFSDAYFFGGEDLELCFRIRRTRRQIIYVQDWRVTHFGGRSSSKASDTIVVDAMLSYGKYFARCRGRLQGVAFRVIVLLLWIPSRMGLSTLRLLTGQASRDQFRQRWRAVRGLMAWRTIR